ESWGSSAIHLCNLDAKTGQMEKTLALLRRIVKEKPETSAAAKAQTRLTLYEASGEVENITSETQEEVKPQTASTKNKKAPAKKVEAQEEPPTPASNLPPGFRPKK